MKKKVLIIGLVSAFAIATSLLTISMASANGPDDFGPGGPGGGMMGPGGPDGGILSKYMTKALASVLGVSEADLTALRDKGETLSDLAIDKGWKSTELRTKMEAARTKAIELALADGAITQAQADAMKEREANRPTGKSDQTTPPAPMKDGFHDEMTAAMAPVFGMTADELTKSLESGKSMMDIAADKGMTVKDFMTKSAEATQTAIKSAVEKGLITQAQADEMLTRMQNRGAGKNDGGHRGGGFNGAW